MTKTIYLVWCDIDNFWKQYDYLAAAVEDNEGSDIYKAIPKKLGRYTTQTSVVKLNEPRKTKAKKKKKVAA